MKTTIDKAGRVVVPKALRDAIGLVPGEVEISVDGAALRIEVPSGRLEHRHGRLMLPRSGTPLTDDQIRDLRLADQR